MTTIAVTGSAEQRHPAERGTVRLSVGAQARSSAAAVAATTKLHRLVIAEIKNFVTSGAATSWSADRVVSYSAESFGGSGDTAQDGLAVRTHAASAVVEVTFADFGALGDWIATVAERDGVSIESVDWTLTDATLADRTLAVRAQAVTDAHARAEAYAAAAGLTLGGLIAIFEPGLRPNTPGSANDSAVFARSMTTTSSGRSFELRPSDITISASITADYEATLPD
jgi:uncharacterized protein